MNDDDFVKQFQSRDIARADQAEAAKVAKSDLQAEEQHVRAHAKDEVRHFEPLARSLVEAISRGSNRLVLMNAAAGFSIKCGVECVTVYEAAPIFANMGVTNMMVAYMRMPGHLSVFGYGEPEPTNRREERYVPRWDADSASIAWHRDGRGPGFSTEHSCSTSSRRYRSAPPSAANRLQSDWQG